MTGLCFSRCLDFALVIRSQCANEVGGAGRLLNKYDTSHKGGDAAELVIFLLPMKGSSLAFCQAGLRMQKVSFC